MRRPAGQQEQESKDAPGGVAEEWNAQLRLSTGAAALLQRVVRCGLWTVVCAGPLLGAVALAQSPSESVAAQRPAAESRASQAVDTAGPGGFAAMYAETYLTTSAGEEGQLAPYFPALDEKQVRLPEKAEADVGQVEPVRVARSSSSAWSVVVSARVGGEEGGGVRYFQVPVAERDGGLVGMSLPAEVAAPAQGEAVELSYGSPAPPREGDPAAATLRGFFGAYLAGDGQLDRFLSPGTQLRAVAPAPYEQVQLRQFALAGTDDVDEGAESGAPADGERLRVLADVSAETAKGVERPMTYALELTARDGRWEVSSAQDAPAMDGEVSR